MKHCKNCGKTLHELYCGNCGQSAKVSRITFSYFTHDFFHFFSHIEKGFLFTSIRMLRSPGKAMKEFIEGKRKNYQSPVSYFLIWTTIYILFLYWIEKLFGENVVINYKEYFGAGETTKFAISHLALVLIIVIPFQALYLYVLVTKNIYNYFETIVAAFYSLGTIILLQFAFALTTLSIYLLSSVSTDLRISDSLKVLYLIWFIFDLIKLFPVNAKFIRAVAFIILAFGTFTLWRIYGVPDFFNWLSVRM